MPLPGTITGSFLHFEAPGGLESGAAVELDLGRLAGDAALPPEQRITRTNIRRPFRPDAPLLPSGLLGPVRLVPTGPLPVRRPASRHEALEGG